ncbi:MAG: alcohol dehydrogenase family protein [Gammaproteobacteria bacterium]
MARTMVGVQLLGHGGLDQLVARDDIPVPQPRADETLVRVRAAGINNTDINTRLGWYAKDITSSTNEVAGASAQSGGWGGALSFPRIQGGDLCGDVVAVGSPSLTVRVGQRVTCAINQPMPSPENPLYFECLGSERDGAFAEFCCVPTDQLFDVSASPLSDVEIGAMPCAYGTALGLLRRAGVRSDDRVLVTGASGGVGLAAVQLAKHFGARVWAVTSPAKAQAVMAAGADDLIDRDGSYPPNSVSVVIDVVGGMRFGRWLDMLCPGGRLATAGAIAGPMAEIDLRTLYLKDLTLYGCTHQSRDVFLELVSLIHQGAIRPLVSKTYPLHEIANAQEDFMSKRYAGKLVLIPPA